MQVSERIPGLDPQHFHIVIVCSRANAPADARQYIPIHETTVSFFPHRIAFCLSAMTTRWLALQTKSTCQHQNCHRTYHLRQTWQAHWQTSSYTAAAPCVRPAAIEMPASLHLLGLHATSQSDQSNLCIWKFCCTAAHVISITEQSHLFQCCIICIPMHNTHTMLASRAGNG